MMRRRHRPHRQAGADFRAVFNCHVWRDAVNGVGQHHVSSGGDDDLPTSAAQSATVIALLNFRSTCRTRKSGRSLGRHSTGILLLADA